MRRLLVAALLVVSTGASFSGIESLQSIDDLFAAEFPLVTDVALDETSDDTDLDLDALMESPESAYRSLDFQPSWMESIESTENQPQRHPNAPHPSQGTDDDVLEPEPAALRGHGASSPQQPSTRFQRTPQGISNAPPTPPQGTKVPSWPPQGPNAPSTPQQGTSVEQRLQEYLNAWKPKYTLDNTEKACVKQHLVKYRRWIEPNTNNNDPRDEPLLSYLYKPGEGRKTFSSWLDADRHYAAASCFLKLRAVKKLEQEWSTVAQDFKILEKNQYWLFKGHVKRSIAQHEAERAASRLQAKLPPLMHNKHKLFKNLMKMAEFSHFNRAVTARFKKIIAKAKFTPARAPLDLWDAMNSIHTAFRRFKEQAVTLTKYNAEKWAWISSLRECYVDRCSPARKQSLLDSQFMDISILQYDTWHNWIDAAYVLTSNTPDWVNSSGTCCNQFFMNNAGEERACNVKTLIKVSCGRSAPCLLSAFGDRERQYAGSSYTLENALVPLDVLGRPTDNPSKSVHQTSYCPAEICALSMVQAIDAMWSHGFCELRQHAAKQFDVAGISDVDFDDVRIPCIPSEPTADGLRRMPLASSVCEHVGLSADELQSINGSYSCWLGAQKKARVSVVRFCCVLDNVEMTLSAY